MERAVRGGDAPSSSINPLIRRESRRRHGTGLGFFSGLEPGRGEGLELVQKMSDNVGVVGARPDAAVATAAAAELPQGATDALDVTGDTKRETPTKRRATSDVSCLGDSFHRRPALLG